jgi:hypothetical protein
MYFLEQEHSGHGSETESTVDSTQGGSGTLVVAAGLSTLGVDTSTVAIGKLALALVLALDQLLLAEVVEERAGDVLSGQKVEDTADAVEFGSVDPGIC